MTDIFLPGGFLGQGMPAALVETAPSGAVSILPPKLLGRGMSVLNFGTEVVESFSLTEGLTVSDSASLQAIFRLIERLDFLDSVGAATIIASLKCEDGAEFTDRIVFGLALLADDSFILTDDLTGFIQKLLTVIDAVTLTDSVDAAFEHKMVLVETLLLLDALEQAKAMTLADGVTLTDVVLSKMKMVLSAVDEMTASDSMSQVLTLILSAADDIAIGDDLTEILILQLALSDGIAFIGRLPIEDQEYLAWVVNPDTGGVWQYTNYPFNSFAFVGGKYLGLKEDGLFELTGSDDDGSEIVAKGRTGLMDYGTSRIKNVPRAYIGYTAEKGMALKTITTETGEKKKERWYRLAPRRQDVPKEGRVKFARGVRARYWGFEIQNIDGGEISFDKIQLLPVILRRRI